MPEFVSYLSTRNPRVISLPAGIRQLDEPIQWALNSIKSNPRYSTLQIMKWDRDQKLANQLGSSATPGGDTANETKPEGVYLLDANHPDTMDAYIDGVKNGRAVHGRLELFNVVSDKVKIRRNAEWPFEIFKRYFFDELKQRHPFGFHAGCTLWLSSGEHIYKAHLDTQDAFLFHLAGEKRLSIWPTPAEYLKQAVVGYQDVEGRMTSQPMKIDLQVGQVVFIPAGAVHEVTVEGTAPAVSVSLHMGSPYPMPILCKKLNKILGEERIFLPDHMNVPEKDLGFFFYPSNYFDRSQPQIDSIPDSLADELLAVLQSNDVDRKQLGDLLSQWWETSIKTLGYVCPYPKEWPD